VHARVATRGAASRGTFHQAGMRIKKPVHGRAPADNLRAMLVRSKCEACCTRPRALRAVGSGVRGAWLGALVALVVTAPGCSKSPSAPPATGTTRSWVMGFSGFPPVPDQGVAVAAINMAGLRSDAAIQHTAPPWDSLLAGVPADTLVRRAEFPLMNYYRNVQGRKLVFEVDLTDGLNRAAEDPALVAAGRSIAEPEVQSLARAWIAAVDTIIHPDWLGIASETNLVRAAASPSLYAALRSLARSAADSLGALHARRPALPRPVLYSSVQVETAWGRLGGGGTYQGVATDLADFPYAQVLGLSSYPYLGGFADPEAVPLDYYSRIASEAMKPVMVVEGGWASASFSTYTTSPAEQARYVRRHAEMLDAAHAVGWLSLEFADLAVSLWPPPVNPTIRYFTALGVVDSALTPKPALAAWDSLFARPLRN
jgi:hypothetical protein